MPPWEAVRAAAPAPAAAEPAPAPTPITNPDPSSEPPVQSAVVDTVQKAGLEDNMHIGDSDLRIESKLIQVN